MALTEAALERRKKYLTASDVPAVLGLSPFRSPLAVWLDKTGQGEKFEGNAATEFGDDFEDALIYRAARRANLTNVRRNQWRVHEGGLLAATLDAVGTFSDKVALYDAAIEAKTSGIINPGSDLDGWGEDGTSEVPDRINVQCQVQLLCADLNVNYVSALLGRGKGHRLYTLRRDNEALKFIVEHCTKWWDFHIVKGNQPAATQVADNEVMKNIRRVPGKTVPIDFALVQAWLDAKEAAKKADAEKELAEAKLKGALGDAEAGEAAGGLFVYAEENAGERFDTKGFKTAHPDLHKQFTSKGTRRVPRWKATA